jgi:NAD(P)-dependent dehydrogenase (short-subunit alcohol dehydrogenase family)
MSQRTAIVTGATGLLGRQVKNAFETRGWTAKGTGYSRADGVDILKVDLGSEDEVRKMIDDVKYAGFFLARKCHY